MRFAEKTAIVVGAAGGIGSAIARGFAQEGARVCLVDRQAATITDVQTADCTPIAFTIDITDRAAVEEMVRQTAEKFGRIDVLVNAAGVTSFGSAAALAEDPPAAASPPTARDASADASTSIFFLFLFLFHLLGTFMSPRI